VNAALTNRARRVLRAPKDSLGLAAGTLWCFGQGAFMSPILSKKDRRGGDGNVVFERLDHGQGHSMTRASSIRNSGAISLPLRFAFAAILCAVLAEPRLVNAQFQSGAQNNVVFYRGENPPAFGTIFNGAVAFSNGSLWLSAQVNWGPAVEIFAWPPAGTAAVRGSLMQSDGETVWTCMTWPDWTFNADNTSSGRTRDRHRRERCVG
jgi:hypothetical protein